QDLQRRPADPEARQRRPHLHLRPHKVSARHRQPHSQVEAARGEHGRLSPAPALPHRAARRCRHVRGRQRRALCRLRQRAQSGAVELPRQRTRRRQLRVLC
ncbi:hypothetical protein BN1708_020123, partial [Verticillium longisporum]